MMAKWISSHRDLPLLLNQWANVLRWEMRPRMFLRTSEFLWQEGHTAHATAADATAETMLALGLYQDVASQAAALATVPGEKTPRERFAGAERTFTIEAMMRDGRALQAGTSHFMGTNFAAAFGITYTGESGTAELCHTTSWGMSTRMIGGLIMTHGDDKGLVLPPALAPYQVVVVPIGRGEQAETTLSAATELAATLQRVGIRTHVDDRTQVSPGFKFNDWEMRGVPIRLELGPRELAGGTTLMSRRLSYPQPAAVKEAIPLDAAPDLLAGELAAVQAMLARRAADFRDDHTAAANSWPEFTAAVAVGWALALHCGEQACEDEIKAETTATPRCIPLAGEPEHGTCIRCRKASAYGKRVIFARAY
jgi:prolyl-tRNA synthetase